MDRRRKGFLSEMSDVQDERAEERKILLKAFTSGTWFQFPKQFLLSMSYGETIFLSFLINHASVVGAEEKHAGWFYCSMKTICRELYLRNTKQQSRIIKSLEDKGFIETTVRDIPARRYIRIRILEIVEHLKADFRDWQRETNGFPD